MTYKLRLIKVLMKLRRDINWIQTMYLASTPIDSEEHKATSYDLMRLMDLECRLINKLTRLEGNK